jgi:hypothetical protein
MNTDYLWVSENLFSFDFLIAWRISLPLTGDVSIDKDNFLMYCML